MHADNLDVSVNLLMTRADQIADALPFDPARLDVPTPRSRRMGAMVSKTQNAIVAAAVSVLFLLGLACIVGGPVWLIKHLHH